MKFGINFTSCMKPAIAVITTGIYPKISLLQVLLQINTIPSYVEVKIFDFQNLFHDK